MKTNKNIQMSKAVFFTIIITLALFTCVFETLYILEKQKYDTSLKACVTLTKINVQMTQSLMDYYNITLNESQDIFVNYLTKDNFKHLKEIQYDNPK